MISFEIVEMHQSNQLARAVARLMATELFAVSPDDLDEEIEDYIRSHSDREYTDYVLLDETDEILGAASVIHGRKGKSETEIIDIAVRPDLQRKGHGYGRLMLHGIAHRAIARNDTIINLFCFDEDVLTGFYQKVGFSPPNEAEPDFVAIDALELVIRAGSE